MRSQTSKPLLPRYRARVCVYSPRMMPRLKHCEGIVARERYIPFPPAASSRLLPLLIVVAVVSFPSPSLGPPTGDHSTNGFSGFERSTAANAVSRSVRASKLNVSVLAEISTRGACRVCRRRSRALLSHPRLSPRTFSRASTLLREGRGSRCHFAGRLLR